MFDNPSQSFTQSVFLPGENVAPSVGDGYRGCMVALYVDSVYRGAQLQLVYDMKNNNIRHNDYFCNIVLLPKYCPASFNGRRSTRYQPAADRRD